MASKIKVNKLADEIMKGLNEYSRLVSDDVKESVKSAGKKAKEEIQEKAPKKTGKYAKSWTVKKTKESSNSIEVTVHSPKKYQLAHLLEFGHAKRGGGRTRAYPHIAPAEQEAAKKLEEEIKRRLGGV